MYVFFSDGDRREEVAGYSAQVAQLYGVSDENEPVQCTYLPDRNKTVLIVELESWRDLIVRRPGWERPAGQ